MITLISKWQRWLAEFVVSHEWHTVKFNLTLFVSLWDLQMEWKVNVWILMSWEWPNWSWNTKASWCFDSVDLWHSWEDKNILCLYSCLFDVHSSTIRDFNYFWYNLLPWIIDLDWKECKIEETLYWYKKEFYKDILREIQDMYTDKVISKTFWDGWLVTEEDTKKYVIKDITKYNQWVRSRREAYYLQTKRNEEYVKKNMEKFFKKEGIEEYNNREISFNELCMSIYSLKDEERKLDRKIVLDTKWKDTEVPK